MPPDAPDKVILAGFADQLSVKASAIENDGTLIGDHIQLDAELREIRKIKNDVVNLMDEAKRQVFLQQISNAEQIIVDLKLRLTNKEYDGFGKRAQDFANALKSASGILRVISAIIIANSISV